MYFSPKSDAALSDKAFRSGCFFPRKPITRRIVDFLPILGDFSTSSQAKNPTQINPYTYKIKIKDLFTCWLWRLFPRPRRSRRRRRNRRRRRWRARRTQHCSFINATWHTNARTPAFIKILIISGLRRRLLTRRRRRSPVNRFTPQR